MSDSRTSRPPFEGDLSEVPISSVLQRLGQDGATGILTIQSDEDIIAISFEDGLIVGADALNETLEDGLGKALTTEGLLTEAQFSDVLERVRSERGRLGDVLLEEDMLSRADYLSALRRYTATLLGHCGDWKTGDYEFYEGDEVSCERGFEAIPVGEVVDLGVHGTVLPAGGGGVEPVAPAAAEIAEAPAGPVESAEGSAGVEHQPVYPHEESASLKVGFEALFERLSLGLDDARQWVTWLVPSLVVLVLLAVVLLRPNALVYPLFWLEPQRLEFEKQRRGSAYLKIDRAAKTFFLLEGRFPDDLHTLVARGLLANHDIVGSRGRILQYVPDDRGYVIRSAVADGTDPGVKKTEAIVGDFFLDPEFVILAPPRDTMPLVLLD